MNIEELKKEILRLNPGNGVPPLPRDIGKFRRYERIRN